MKRHHNILYAITVILLIMQIGTFVVMSVQVSKVNTQLAEARSNLSMQERAFGDFQQQNQENFQQIAQRLQEVSDTVDVQKNAFDKEISLLKSSQQDFSGIIEDSVKSVVSIATERSMGSGFIIGENGYVVTNAHVIDDSTRIRVLTYDRKVITASLIGEDEVRDLALLKIDGNYEAIELGDSDESQVGNKVIAIGNPLGLSFTVTEGIVSALNRRGSNGLEDYIQTDVSLNPGNSGGPLINTKGEVVGMNNFKVGNAESLGFALESNVIRIFVEQSVNSTILA